MRHLRHLVAALTVAALAGAGACAAGKVLNADLSTGRDPGLDKAISLL
ncbi:hypothetical protein NLX83_28845 [Allokutzneria sp. A3M-2-11 16]|nr:hypothetical protein [Allokutzneria sp. A3M-2-11 16]MCP3803293.1 hypothetical protein [Allokutzneria sp. A3M-2-11 16]